MIEKIEVSNFKCFSEKISVDFKNLTLISGLNSSGKTSIYQAILLLEQSKNSTCNLARNIIPELKINGEYVDFGSAKELLNDLKNNYILFKIYYENGGELLLQYKLSKDGSRQSFILSETEFVGSVDKFLSKYKVFYDEEVKTWHIKAKHALEFSNHSIGRVFYEYIENKSKLNKKEKKELISSEVEFSNISDIIFIKNILLSFAINIENLTECLTQEGRALFDLSEFRELCKQQDVKLADKIKLTFADHYFFFMNESKLFPKVKFIRPHRPYPKRVYTAIDKHPMPNYENLLNSKRKVQYKYENGKIQKTNIKSALSYWLVDKLKLIEDIKVEYQLAGYMSEIFIKYNKKWVPINHVGFGISQVLPIVYSLLLNSSDAFFVIDEPETHLHPGLQSKIAEFLYQMSLMNKRILVETHSDYLINMLIYYMLKHNETTPSVKMYWVEKIPDSGTKINEILYDNMGYITNAPEGFLSEHFNISSKISKIRLEKIRR